MTAVYYNGNSDAWPRIILTPSRTHSLARSLSQRFDTSGSGFMVVVVVVVVCIEVAAVVGALASDSLVSTSYCWLSWSLRSQSACSLASRRSFSRSIVARVTAGSTGNASCSSGFLAITSRNGSCRL